MPLNLLRFVLVLLSLIFSVSFSTINAKNVKQGQENKSDKKTSAKKISVNPGISMEVSTVSANEATDEEVDGSHYVLNCSECHGFDGNSLNQEWPNIAGLNHQYIIRQLDDFKTGKRVNPEMTLIVREFPSSKELTSLAKYFSKQKMVNKNTPESISNHEFVDLKIGKEIFTGKRVEYGIPACSACHGKDGMGDEAGKYPRLAGQNMDYIIKQMELFRSKKRANDNPPQMRGIAGQMDDEDIASVAAYIAYMKPE